MEQTSSKVVHDVRGGKRLLIYCPIQGRVVSQKVRDEDEYMEHLGKIIQRDFFPDLSEMKGEPCVSKNPTVSERSLSGKSEVDSRNPEQSNPIGVSLDKYLANNTTEDDASFAELIEESEKKHRIKLSPFFPSFESSTTQAISASKMLALPSTSEAVVGPRVNLAGNNAVHFNPDGVAQTKEEFVEHLSNERKIVANNTRFKHPLPVVMDKKRAVKRLLATKLGHVGLDGIESQTPFGTPQAAGYKFLDASPSPSFSLITQSPLMTWGELDSTPFRLDEGGLTPSVISGTPAFHIPSPSEREQLAHKLADKAGRQRVRDRLEAVKRVHSGASSPSRSMLSPAARRLLASSSSIMCNDLNSRPSTGSPFPKSNTPRRLPSDLGVIRRPISVLSTPLRESTKSSSSVQRLTCEENHEVAQVHQTNIKHSDSTCSITDNLLNLKSSHGTPTVLSDS